MEEVIALMEHGLSLRCRLFPKDDARVLAATSELATLLNTHAMAALYQVRSCAQPAARVAHKRKPRLSRCIAVLFRGQDGFDVALLLLERALELTGSVLAHAEALAAAAVTAAAHASEARGGPDVGRGPVSARVRVRVRIKGAWRELASDRVHTLNNLGTVPESLFPLCCLVCQLRVS